MASNQKEGGAALRLVRLPLFILGLALVFVAERYLSGAGTTQQAVRWSGAGVAALGAVLTLVLSIGAAGRGLRNEATAWRYAFLWQLGVLAALGLFAAYRYSLGEAAVPDKPLAKVLLGGWLSVFALSVASGIGIEWAMRDNGRGPYAEPNRVCRSGLSWLMVGMLLAFLTSMNYAANVKDVTRDWSYLKVTSPSDSTVALLKGVTGDVTVALFYPPGNEVRLMLAQYFDAVAKKEPRVKVSYYDKDMNPTEAENLRVSRNGQIVFDVAGKRSRIDTGTTLAKARKTLRGLDAEFQKSFLEVTAEKKTLYFARGHGEASWIGDAADDPLRSLTLLEGFLRQQNYTVKLFGVGEGSASTVPDDAAAVVIVGPTRSFQKEEIEALKTYVDKGGNVLVYLDLPQDTGTIATDGPDPLKDWLAGAGIKFNAVPLNNERNYVSMSRAPSDHWFIFSNIFTSHDSVVGLARNDERIAVLAYQAGYLTVTPELAGWKAFETVRSLSDTCADLNRNFTCDPNEKKDSYVLGAVAEKKLAGKKDEPVDPKKKSKNSRVLVFADATGLADAIVRNPGNAVFFADSLKWVMGDPELAGQPTTEEDVKIRHTNKEEAIWFNVSVVVVPLLVLLVGFVATRRKRVVAKAAA